MTVLGKGLRRGAAALALAAAATLGGAVTAGAEEAPSAMGLDCGYDTDVLGINAYYTHCDSTTWVVIKVLGGVLAPDEMCVGPGTTRLGFTNNVQYAYYAGRLC
ncbi:DUF6355 family natural product biosynthesis protein [Amycolatopsis magusensis]|uniref:DUF6355 family natural product biosynthesis protein n=1 Tax=Amycolatopsis magusensis TaxID=882444 RepID=UPI00379F3FFE